MIAIVKNGNVIIKRIPNPHIQGDGRRELCEFIKTKHPSAEINYKNTQVHLDGHLIYYNSFTWVHHSKKGSVAYSICDVRELDNA